MPFIKFIDNKSYWSDKDCSESDKITYYKAPDGYEVGHPFHLKNGKLTPFTKEECVQQEQQKQKDELINKLSLKAKKESDRRIQTIPAVVRSTFGLSHKDKHYKDPLNWIHFYSMCQHIVISKRDTKKYAQWVLYRIVTIYSCYKNILNRLQNMSKEDMESFDVTDNKYWCDVPLPNLTQQKKKTRERKTND